MTTLVNILHITPHLGGGVGKALSSFLCNSAGNHSTFRHSVVCLEQPEKMQFVNIIQKCAIPIYFCPSESELKTLVEQADIVQLEFWNHPVIPAYLCGTHLPPHRLVVWSHVSGLYHPKIPDGMLSTADRFLFTSPCSYETPEIKKLPEPIQNNLGVVSSGTVDNTPPAPIRTGETLRAGYAGSLNFSKLHPDFVQYLNAVKNKDFKVKIYGDPVNRDILTQQCRKIGRPGLLDFCGYSEDIYPELANLDVLLYLLNPEHYGTAENVLLEAMAMGVVPIVCNNPAERNIVDHQKTGLIINSPGELASAIEWLRGHPKIMIEMGKNASVDVRGKYSAEAMIREMEHHYQKMLRVKSKKAISYEKIFGATRFDWFISFFRDKDKGICEWETICKCKEKRKGSAFHFANIQPKPGDSENTGHYCKR